MNFIPDKNFGFGLMRLPLNDPSDAGSIDMDHLKKMVDLFILVLDLVIIVCLTFTPTIASWIVHSSGATEIAGKITSVGKKAASLAKMM